MKFRKIFAVSAAVAMLASFTACSKGESKPYVAVVSKGFQHQFWQVVKKGAEQAAKDYGVEITFDGPPTESDINEQVNMLNNAMTKNRRRSVWRRWIPNRCSISSTTARIKASR